MGKERSKGVREDIVVGATFPDYQLEDQGGSPPETL